MRHRAQLFRSRTLLLIIAPLTLGTVVLVSTGCNTVEGVGEDVEAVGEGVDEAAEENQ